eukprot:CAMPEP_0201481288 /NCGR_PEP_ID=MMETSP0151_2-20130828/5559_1 /ASSEMBLY_ACC=CAM_ASM_000257 /TAXON_ID=200890 /ORGANISM="Paramoeba atlantica, Strain 621/1 / CCAP 1560/9" /LENGTH=2208 /DNA_ID=CAMNT_0047863397 /DNA_START=222 /DNA_END=6848 /DNA_ORIENTATION=-
MKNSFGAAANILSLSGVNVGGTETQIEGTPGTGSFSSNVNDIDGTLLYSLPIQVPLGTAGMQPRLALSFSSSGGENHYGLGWDLEGSSSVFRCSQAKPQDLLNVPVQFDSSDRYCVDADRLIAMPGYVRGTDGAHYRTEVDSYSDVISYINNGEKEPSYFVVKLSSGITRVYGNSTDSRIKTSNGMTRVWALNRAIDLAGNYVDFVYDSPGGGEYYLDKISYTGNDLNNAAKFSGSLYSSVISFGYQSRTSAGFDNYQVTMKGTSVDTTMLCTSISTSVSDDTGNFFDVYTYNLQYEADPFLPSVPRLATVQQCRGSTCNAPYVFVYTTITNTAPTRTQTFKQYQSPINYQLWSDDDDSALQLFQMADFNGDGLSDLMYLDTDATSKKDGSATVKAYLTSVDGSGNVNPYSSAITGPPLAGGIRHNYWDTDVNRVQLVDWNNDGCMDIYMLSLSATESDTIYLWDKQTNKFDKEVTGPSTWVYDFNQSSKSSGLDISRYKFGDFDGNGFVDVYLVNFNNDSKKEGNATDILYLNMDGAGTTETKDGLDLYKHSYHDYEDAGDDCTRYKVQDMNGDGITDIYYILGDGTSTTTGILYVGPVYDNPQTITGVPLDFGQDSNGDTLQIDIQRLNFGDFNGDGYQDIYIISLLAGSNDVIYYFDGVSYSSEPVRTTRLGVDQCKVDAAFSPRGRKRHHSNEDQDQAVVGSYHFVEMNGDGCTDIYITHQTQYCSDHPSDVIAYSTKGETHQFETVDGVLSGVYTVGSNFDQGRVLFGDINGDGMLDLHYIASDSKSQKNGLILTAPNNQTFMTEARNPQGVITGIKYKPITFDGVYQIGSDAVYPTIDFQGSAYVVTEIFRELGSGYFDNTSYFYEHAQQDQSGWGFLGFGSVTAVQLRTGITMKTNYSQNVPSHLQMYETQEQVTSSDGTELRLVTYDYTSTPTVNDNDATYWAINRVQIVETMHDLDGAYMGTSTSSFTYDQYGNILTSSTVDKDDYVTSYTESVTRNYYINPEEWFFTTTNTTTTKVLKASGVDDTNIIYSNYTYDEKGLMIGQCTQSKVSTDHGMYVCQVYGLDIFGNRLNTTLSGLNRDGSVVTPRNIASDYSADVYGRFVYSVTDAEGLSLHHTYDYPCNAISSSQAAGMLKSAKVLYTPFCLPRIQTFVDGSTSQVNFEYCDSSCPSDGVIKVTSSSPLGIETINIMDKTERMIKTTTPAFNDNKYVSYSVEYGDNGKVSRVSNPYFEDVGPSDWTSYTYDALDRVVRTDFADGSFSTVDYNGPVVTTTNTLGQTASSTMNMLDEIVETEDDSGNKMSFTYGALGEVLTSLDPKKAKVTVQYDGFGHRTEMVDPNLGTNKFFYDVLGNELSRTNAYGYPITFVYDKIGRPVTRTNRTATTYFNYNSFGKLSNLTLGIYFEEYYYDSIGRVLEKYVRTGSDNHEFFTNTSYDQYSRVSVTTFPSNFTVMNVYDDNWSGHLTSVIEVGTNRKLYEVLSKNPDGTIAQYKIGDAITTSFSYDVMGRLLSIQSVNPSGTWLQNLSYTWDVASNLLTRIDYLKGLEEVLTYDNLNRLTSSTIYQNGTQSHQTNMKYDVNGNILSNSDVGSYTYGASHPHAVTKAGSLSYKYDVAGNALSKGSMTFQYNDDSLVTNSKNNDRASDYEYGPFLQLIRRYDYNPKNGNTGIRKVFYGDSFVRNQEGDNGDEVPHQDLAFYGTSLFHSKLIQPSGSYTQNYYGVLRDHLGSIDIIIDLDTLNITNRESYSFSGIPRDPFTWTAPDWNTTQFDGSTEQGFTGHLKLDYYNVHLMGPRLYDPQIGRFLNPDPHCGSLANMQALNKYSYVNNRPLSDADPSGFDGQSQHSHPIRHAIFKFFRKLARRVVDALLFAACGGPECMALFDATVSIVADKIEGKSWKSAFADGAAHFLADEFGGSEPSKRLTSALGEKGTKIAQKLAGGFIMGVNSAEHGDGFGSGFADGYQNGFGDTFHDDFTISTHAENHFKKGEWVAGALDVAQESAEQQMSGFVKKMSAQRLGVKPAQLKKAKNFIQYGDLVPWSSAKHIGRPDFTKLGNAAFFLASNAHHAMALIDPLITIVGQQVNGADILKNAATGKVTAILQHGPPEAAMISAVGFFRGALPKSAVLDAIPGLIPGVNEIVASNSAVSDMCLGLSVPMNFLSVPPGGASTGAVGNPHGMWMSYAGYEFPVDLWGKSSPTSPHE